MFKKIKKASKAYIFEILLLILIIVIGFILRIYNIHDTLGFYYDQGRDALVIWDFWHNANLFLIGPTTGIAGILRAPFYYYLIAPFYLLGGGNPVWPSYFLSLTTVIASLFGYYLGKKIHSTTAGILMAIISSFSFNIVMASRWLSNPTPMLLCSMLLLFFMVKVTENKKWGWYGISLISGLSLFSFGSASEVFYFVALFIFAIWNRKTINKKVILVSLLFFFLTILPLVVFEFRNNFLISGNIKKFLVDDQSFKSASWDVILQKLTTYKRVFSGLLFHTKERLQNFVFGAVLVLILVYFKNLFRLKGVKIILLLLVSASLGLLFFQGNEGNFYDYYLTGYYMIFLLLLSIGLGEIWEKTIFGKLLILLFLFLFFKNNYYVLNYKLNDKVSSPGSIALKTELLAVNWIKNDVRGREFNVDVYVPPVIPYAYDYLFKWQGVTQSEKEVSLLYTLYEGDPDESQRLKDWIKRQNGIAKVEEKVRFGGVTVERRTRYQKK